MASVEPKLQRDAIPMPTADPPSEISEVPAVVGYLASAALTIAATAVAVGIDRGVTIPNLSLVFVVPVVISGVGFGLGPSLLSAIVGALAFNFFLTEPRYSFTVADPSNVWAIGLLFLVGLIVSGVAFTSRRRASDAALLGRQVGALQGYSRDVGAADSVNTIVALTTRTLAAMFDAPAVVILIAGGKIVSVDAVGAVKPQDTDLEAARLSASEGTTVRAGIYPALAARFDFWPFAAATGLSAVIGLALDPDERPAAPDALVGTVASVLVLALDRQHLRDAQDTVPAG